jgi:nucleotide-binding universal stress UspA family protein
MNTSPHPYPITKILLPYDGSPSARLALDLAASLGRTGGPAVQGLTLLHVTGGSYLATHVKNVDLRVAHLDQVKEWQRVRQSYLDKEIMPLLGEAKHLLHRSGFEGRIEMRVVEGKVSEEIARLAREESFSTIVMGRRGLTPLRALLLGSVTRKVLSLAKQITMYVAGQETTPQEKCPLAPLLLPVDGSTSSLAAVRQAAALARAFRPLAPRLILFHVIDIALLGLAFQEGVDDLARGGEQALAGARAILQDAGLEGLWEEKLVSGHPARAIVQEAETGEYALVMMGCKGYSSLEQILLGSVASYVAHRLTRPAVAVAYP